MPGKPVNNATRTLIKNMRARGDSTYKIGAHFGIDPTTVSRIAKAPKKTRSSVSTKAKRGRPHKLTPADARFAALSLARTRNFTAVDLQREFFPCVSPQTIRRMLRDAGLHAYIRRKVPFINRLNRTRRLAWCRDHILWPLAQWLRGVFSDESKFNVFGSDGKQYVWRRKGEALDPRYTSKLVKHGGGSVMVWGCITSRGVGRLHRIDGILTGIRYTEILEESLLGTLQDHHLSPQDVFFQHDNDPKHTSRVAKKWLADHSFNVLPWPASSPDLNIIEHVWDYVDRKVRARDRLPRSKDDLWAMLQEEWHCVPQSYIDKLYASIPTRVQSVIDASGGNTRF